MGWKGFLVKWRGTILMIKPQLCHKTKAPSIFKSISNLRENLCMYMHVYMSVCIFTQLSKVWHRALTHPTFELFKKTSLQTITLCFAPLTTVWHKATSMMYTVRNKLTTWLVGLVGFMAYQPL